MRVAHLCRQFSPLSETFIYDYVTELERQGVSNHVLTFERLNAAERPFPAVTVVRKPGRWNVQRLWRRIWVEFRGEHPIISFWSILRRRLKKALRRIHPDIVHAHFGPRGALVAPVARELGIPLVVSFHGFDAFRLPQEKIWRDQIAALCQGAEVVTVVSKMMQNHLVQLGSPAERTRVVHVGKRIQDYPFHSNPNGRIERWMSVGRMAEKKGHIDCLAAFKQVSEGRPVMSLSLIGGGELLPEVQFYIEREGLSDKVKLLGMLPHEQVKHRMERSDAFILCSKTAKDGDREGIPTVLMEAQAMGLPCVTTRHSGIPEVIPDENHWMLAEEGNVAEIVDRMKKLMSCSPEEVLQISKAGRTKVESDFNLTQEVDKLRALYGEAIGKNIQSVR